MVQLVTMDTYFVEGVRPITEKRGALSFFFIFFIVGVFVLMNLVTAIIVENAFAIAKEDSEHQAKLIEEAKKHELKSLAELFLEIDEDGSGELSKTEFFNSLKLQKVREMLDLLHIKIAELKEIWVILDDGDGLLTIREFTDGIRRMKGDAKAKDVIDVIKKLKTTASGHARLKSQADRFQATLQELEHDSAQTANDTVEVVTLFQEMFHRFSAHIERGEQEDKARAEEERRLARLAAAEEGGEEGE